MKRITLLSSLSITALATLSGFFALAAPQFRSDSGSESIDISKYPIEMQKSYKVFVNKCSECHGLSSSLRYSRSAAGWKAEVYRMQSMPSSHINDHEADEIIGFLNYDESHRKSAETSTNSGAATSPGVGGKELYEKYNCSACHSVAGVGNNSFPLDGIGSRRTEAELKKLILSPPSGSAMPPTGASGDEIEKLVAYLVTLKNH